MDCIGVLGRLELREEGVKVSKKENYDEKAEHLEKVFGNAFWALVDGADREALIREIDEAIKMFQDEVKTGQLPETIRAYDAYLKVIQRNSTGRSSEA
jgi:hypothetical protein